MSKVERQQDANQFSEAGLFYPTGHIVAGFEHAKGARDALKQLKAAGFSDEQARFVSNTEMAREAEKNLQSPSFFASMGSSLPVREKQLELAQQGWNFLLIHAPHDADEARATQALDGSQVGYAIKYRALIIENLLPNIATRAEHAPARVP